MILPQKSKIARIWTILDVGLQFVGTKPRNKKLIKKYSSKKVRKYIKNL
jgi:hypothetical protein